MLYWLHISIELFISDERKAVDCCGGCTERACCRWISHPHGNLARRIGDSCRTYRTGGKAGTAGAGTDGTRGDEPLFPQAHYGTEPRNEWEIFDHAAVLEQSLEVVTAAKRTGCRQWSDPALRHGNGAAQRRLWAFRICEPGYAAGFHYCIAPRTIG